MISLGLPWQEMNDYPKHIRAVTLEQVQQVAKKYLTLNQLTEARLEPQLLPQKVVPMKFKAIKYVVFLMSCFLITTPAWAEVSGGAVPATD